MPFLELSLAISFTRNIDPSITILKNITGNPWTLTSSPIVFVKNGAGTQLVYSALPYKPWGITPTCRVCKQFAKATTAGQGDKYKNHEKLKLTCSQWRCGLVEHVERPQWVFPVQDRPFFFYYDYPLTIKKLQALGCH
jgi:hypothetical protein